MVALKVKAILFDLYLTLIDLSEVRMNELNNVAFNILLNNGLEVDYNEFHNVFEEIYGKWREFRQNTLIEINPRVWWSEILLKLNISADIKLVEEIINARHRLFKRKIKVYPDVKNCLENLRKIGLKIGLVSNSSDGNLVIDELNFLKLNKFFDIIALSADFGYRKPSKVFFEKVLEILNITPEEAIFVGDDLSVDILGAHNVGLKAVYLNRTGVNEENINVDITVTTLSELIDVLTYNKLL